MRLRGDGFFGSGSADPMAQSLPVLKRIGEALAEVKGEVLITGHTDNQPIRSLRYPSNWHLSEERADAVKSALADAGRAGAHALRRQGRCRAGRSRTTRRPTARATGASRSCC